MGAWRDFWDSPNYVDSGDGTPIEVTHHIEGNIFSGYQWMPNAERDDSKDYRPHDYPLF
ncbi:MAG: hypothetical protein ACREQ5_00200 [Candidatus Dormibacteria bacterium]